ncbi:MAG: hypothetical protein J6L60_10030, partial [Bacteroidaceae bacterium]|nr:hypothetical protein [Bacteroidaceae bacterium]
PLHIMTLYRTLLTILLAAIFTACTEHGDFERRLATADSLMTHEMPDSAYRMLCGMDAEAEEVSEPLRMRHLLLRSNAQNKAYVDFTSDSIGCLLVDYYDAHGTPNERMLAHYIKGCAYRDMGDQPASLRCYNDAVAAADTSRADCNYDQLSIIYGQIADIFDRRAMPDNALQAYEYAERYAWKAKDTINVLTIWGNKSNALINQGKIGEALRIKEAAAEGFENMGYPQKSARVLGLCIKWYARQGKFDKAKAAMNEYENHSGYFLENGDAKPGKEGYYHIKGTYFLEKGEMDSAEHYFRKLQQSGTTRNDLYLAAWGMTQLYYGKMPLDSIGKYALQTLAHNDTLYNIRAAENLQNAQAMYDYARHQEKAHRKELEAKEAKLKQFKWVIRCIVIAVLASILCGGGIFFWRKRSRKFRRHFKLIHQYIGQKKTELDISRQEKSDLCTQLHTANEENALLNTQIDAYNQKINRLNEQIKDKTRLIQELNKTINQNATDLQLKEQMQQTIAILQERVDVYQKEIDIHTQTHSLNLLQQLPDVKRMLEMGLNRKVKPTYKDWHALYPLVEEFCPKLAVIRNDIDHADYQICVLTKLGCKLSDIVYLTGLNNNNLSTRRLRLLKKLFHTNVGGAAMFDKLMREL